MQILAVYPCESEQAVFEKMPPLGMLWIGGQLRRAGYGVEFVDQQVDPRDCASLAEAARPRLALIGGTSHSRFVSFENARRIKQRSPETIVVYGGPHASFTAEDTLTHIRDIDVVVRGEGEEPCLELAEWAIHGSADPADLSRIRGIAYRVDGRVAQTPVRPPIRDLDALGPPDRDLVPLARYAMTMDYLGVPGTSIMTARGCPIACTFCSASAMFGKSYRARSPVQVVDEIEGLLTRHGVQGIKIFDSTFTLQRAHVEGFCAELRRRGLHIPWECELRAGSVDRRLLETMREAGCYYVDVGIESGSQRVLDACVHKQISLESAVELLRWTRELDLLTKVFFTLGHPGETLREARETNRFIRRHRRNIRLSAYQAGVKIYPGTMVEQYAREHQLMPEGFRWSAPYRNLLNRRLFRAPDNVPLLLQPGLGIEELRRLRIEFILMRVTSPRFVWEKLRAILRTRRIGEYLRIVGRGAGLARSRRRPG
jgi:radical SAM superfamily enzyme YgiQ (UPF0313 family)